MSALILLASLRPLLTSPPLLVLLGAVPLLLPTILLGRFGPALVARRGSRWLRRASPEAGEGSGRALIPSTSAGKSSGAPTGVPPAPAEEEILLTVLGVHLELPPIVWANGGYRQILQHRWPHLVQWSTSSLWLDWPPRLRLLRYPHRQPSGSGATFPQPGRVDFLVLLIPPGQLPVQLDVILTRSFRAAHHIGLIRPAACLPVQRDREVYRL